MDSELETRVNFPVVRVTRGVLYTIVAVLGILILAGVCVLTYSFSTSAILKRNAEELRQYIASQAKVAGQHRGDKHAADGTAVGDHHLPSVKSPVPAAAGTGLITGAQLGTRDNKCNVFVGRSANGTLALTARQLWSVTASSAQHQSAGRGAGGDELPAAVAAVKSIS
ncbi:hypothetical protein HPB49_013578 [Dermacentor silvarum]|uniref:Uncharacterized protein n=1 Tax=Dermacentor silvarum TaxID=543639 RepID=A0ACB8DDL3_DERSI|nr:hypothetical protein HPB49_013578 [Dermacentor silvarum]